jgi:hypothetical protein
LNKKIQNCSNVNLSFRHHEGFLLSSGSGFQKPRRPQTMQTTQPIGVSFTLKSHIVASGVGIGIVGAILAEGDGQGED